MLRGIRTASANWLGKAVMGVVMSLLIVSFAIWGIGLYWWAGVLYAWQVRRLLADTAPRAVAPDG